MNHFIDRRIVAACACVCAAAYMAPLHTVAAPSTEVLPPAQSHAAPPGQSQPPPPAIVCAVPDSGRWTMKLIAIDPTAQTAGSSAPAVPKAVVELRYSKTGTTWRVETQLAGKDVEYWRQGSMVIEPVPGARLPLVLPLNSSAPSQPFFSRGFYGTQWIKPELYRNRADYKGADCYYYKSGNGGGGAPKSPAPAGASKPDAQAKPQFQNAAATNVSADPAATSVPASPAQTSPIPLPTTPSSPGLEAWVDTKTLLPVAVRHNGLLFEYAFDTPPAAPLSLPPQCQEAWNVYQEQAARLKALQMP